MGSTPSWHPAWMKPTSVDFQPETKIQALPANIRRTTRMKSIVHAAQILQEVDDTLEQLIAAGHLPAPLEACSAKQLGVPVTKNDPTPDYLVRVAEKYVHEIRSRPNLCATAMAQFQLTQEELLYFAMSHLTRYYRIKHISAPSVPDFNDPVAMRNHPLNKAFALNPELAAMRPLSPYPWFCWGFQAFERGDQPREALFLLMTALQLADKGDDEAVGAMAAFALARLFLVGGAGPTFKKVYVKTFLAYGESFEDTLDSYGMKDAVRWNHYSASSICDAFACVSEGIPEHGTCHAVPWADVLAADPMEGKHCANGCGTRALFMKICSKTHQCATFGVALR
ncbi:hypothetical protein WJX72_012555 [[Myrmecia] bisecta]|uniref:Uncharacterized protein n=1 Tax=[Myrmecia] bisecta TaxID=41462 RepID=A0AAW1PDN7_9CHLO